MKNKSYIFLLLVFAILMIAGFFVVNKAQAPQIIGQRTFVGQQNPAVNNVQQPANNNAQIQKPQIVDPLPNALSRITKKPFGIFITPKNSPVQPERFSGFHNAVDLETFPEEQNMDVSVKALCDGKLLSARTASGYGGVAIQSCTLDGQAVTIVYGHIKISSVAAKIGDQLKAGDFLANLGKGFSAETDGERKHLHLGIHKGASINILGYVQNKNQLNDWIDPGKYLQ